MNFDNKEVLILGGTGSLGSTLTKKLLKDYNIKGLRIYSRSEYLQWKLQNELEKQGLNDKVAFLIGDVRDKDRLFRAMSGVDIVINCAAMKQVPACEFNPAEAVKTNIIGSQNIIDCAIDQKVKKVMHISTDKACLDYHTRIETDLGIYSIRDIVVNKMRVNVKSFDGEKFVFKPILNWYKNKLNNRQLYRISFINQIYGSRRTKRRLIATEDHPILTTQGYKKAKDLNGDDLVYTNIKIPNGKQMEVIVGTLLGDSGIYKRKSSHRNLISERYYIKMGHAENQKEWLSLKRKSLEGLLIGKTTKRNRKCVTHQCFYSFVVKPVPVFVDLYNEFYYNNERVLPKRLIEKYFSPLLMATWFIDDGCNSQADQLLRLATHRYSRLDVEWLKDFFIDKGLECSSYPCKYKDKIYYEIRFTKIGSIALTKYISEYVPDKFQYKLRQDSLKKFDSRKWSLGEAEILKDKVTIEKTQYKTNRDVYCIDVKDTHNFVANDIVVHNCQPINLYGATKTVAESLFINGNVYTGGRDTIFSCCRYGNVIGSRGSVVELFKQQREKGLVYITDERMTRFWITLDQVVQFIIDNIETMQGEEIFIPKMPSMGILDLKEAVAPGCNVKVIGIRKGEKLHETLISEYETVYLIEGDNKYILDFRHRQLQREWDYRSDNNGWKLSIDELRRMI